MIVQHGTRCRRCGDRIFSNSRHDFVRCRCGATFIDGGWDYMRGGFRPEVGPGIPITRKLAARPKRRYRSR